MIDQNKYHKAVPLIVERVAQIITGTTFGARGAVQYEDKINDAAQAIVTLVLGEATKIKRPDISRRYCTNDEAFFNEGFDTAINAIHVLISKKIQ